MLLLLVGLRWNKPMRAKLLLLPQQREIDGLPWKWPESVRTQVMNVVEQENLLSFLRAGTAAVHSTSVLWDLACTWSFLLGETDGGQGGVTQGPKEDINIINMSGLFCPKEEGSESCDHLLSWNQGGKNKGVIYTSFLLRMY